MENKRRPCFSNRLNLKRKYVKLDVEEELLEAIEKGDVDEVLKFVHDGDDMINRRLTYVEGHESKEFTPLCIAIEHAHIEMVKQLLLCGADVEKRGKKTSRGPLAFVSRMQLSPLFLAVKHERKEIIRLLITHGASSEVSWGCCSSNEEERTSVDHTEMTDNGRHDTVLHVAMHCNLSVSASILLAGGADATCLNHRGESPLHLACQHGATKLIELLVHHGGICQQRDSSGLTPLQHFFSSLLCGDAQKVPQVMLTLVLLLDAGYQLKNETWLRKIGPTITPVQTDLNVPWSTMRLNFILWKLKSTVGKEALKMLFTWDHNVRSLFVLSRTVIRRTLGSVNVRAKINTLPLPICVKDNL